jgi:hypothetical protein
MMRRLSLVAPLALAVAFPAVTAAQTWRTFDASRQAHDTQALAVHVTYGAGRVRVQPAPGRSLFDVHLRYDAERVDPVYRFDAAARTLEVGVHHASAGKNMRGGQGSEFRLQLARSVPMRLTLDVGAAEGDYDLSGLQLDELTLQTGATDTRMRFDTPNPRRMRVMRMKIGAASAHVTGLANANAERIEVDLGVGQAELEFGGEWRGDMDVSVTSALGQVTLRVPNDVGIRIETSTFLHSLDAPGMVKRDGYSESANWARARYKLRLRSSGALGQLEIQRIAR